MMTAIDRANDKIHEAVEEAISAGMTAKQFKEAAAESWQIICKDMGLTAAKELLKS